MPKPVSQEDLDFAHTEDDRYLHELNQWRKEGLRVSYLPFLSSPLRMFFFLPTLFLSIFNDPFVQKALEEEYVRRQQDREAARKEGLRRWHEFERERQELSAYWQRKQDQIIEEQ